MSNDTLCIGVCLIDPDTGVCLGCGRTPEEIAGVPVPPAARALAAVSVTDGLPVQVAELVGESE